MFKLKRRGSVFYVHYTDKDGNRQRLSTGETDESAATLRAFELMKGQIEGGEAAAKAAFTVSARRKEQAETGPAAVAKSLGLEVTVAAALVEALATVWEGQKSMANRQSHIKELTADLGHLSIQDVTYDRLVEYGKILARRGNSPATRNRKLSTLQVALRQQHHRGRLLTMPRFPSYKEAAFKERYLTREEQDKLVQALLAQDDGKATYMAHLVVFLAETGARATEALTLGEDQVRDENVWFKHGTTKNGRGRCVPLTAAAKQALDKMMASRWHNRFDVDWATKRYRKVADQVGLHDTTLHTLRHTCASRLVQAGVPLYSVMHWLGHSGMNVTQRYAHLSSESPLANALAIFEKAR